MNDLRPEMLGPEFLLEHIRRDTKFDADLLEKIISEWKRYKATGIEPDMVVKTAELAFFVHENGLDRLRELLAAEKDGRLVVLPCKVGGTVFAIASCAEVNTIVDDDYEHGTGAVECPFEDTCDIEECDDSHVRIFESKLDGFVLDSFGGKEIFVEHITTDGGWVFGQNVFLTREEAEAALRGEEITDCDKCDIWSEDGENCGWTHDGKDFVCVRGHILTAKEKQAALRKSSELRKHDEAAPGEEREHGEDA
ncbi:hypothetical protein [Oscillibacter ruminantium]|uniref:hypothetical protein n=1 Tax=Oscillibacter ruminantium TaxID=1263547 RepID=UPI00332BA359